MAASNHDDEPTQPKKLRPIPGADEDSANLPFPGDKNTKPKPQQPDSEADAERVQPLHSIPGPNEIAAMLEERKKRIVYSEREGLYEWAESAKLLALMWEVHGYKGERYETFALAHTNIKKPRDAHSLYLLGHGTNGDDALAACEAQSRLQSNYDWPSWRKVVADLRREAKRRETGDGAGPPEPEPDTTPEPVVDKSESQPDRVADLVAERDALNERVQTATQLAKKAEGKLAEARTTIAKLEAEIVALKQALNERDTRTAPPRYEEPIPGDPGADDSPDHDGELIALAAEYKEDVGEPLLAVLPPPPSYHPPSDEAAPDGRRKRRRGRPPRSRNKLKTEPNGNPDGLTTADRASGQEGEPNTEQTSACYDAIVDYATAPTHRW